MTDGERRAAPAPSGGIGGPELEGVRPVWTPPRRSSRASKLPNPHTSADPGGGSRPGVLTRQSAPCAGRRFLVGGDWNISPEIWDGVHPGATERAFFDRARSDGWIDAREHLGLDELPTWHQPPYSSYQLDHVFADRQTADSLRSLEVDSHPAFELGLSDHAPVVLELDLPLPL